MVLITFFLVDIAQFNLQLILELLYITGHGLLLLEHYSIQDHHKLVAYLNTVLLDQLLDNQLVSLFQQMQPLELLQFSHTISILLMQVEF